MALVLGSKAVGRQLTFLRSNGYIYVSSASYYGRAKIGTREIVGYGTTGSYDYFDRMDFPYPAIRFREVKGDLIPIKEKEKGDWRNLTIEEKKMLYRASFCRTFAECSRSAEGEWKPIMSNAMVIIGLALWAFILMKKYVCGPMPESTSEEMKEKQLAWYVKIRVDPIDGLGSLYDYEKDEWKPKKPWYLFWQVP